MSKDLESELKEYAKDQTPDLWDRIVCGIEQEEKQTTETTVKKRRKKGIGRNSQKMRLFGSIAACFVALALTVPVFRYVTESNQQKQNETSTVESGEVLEMANATTDAQTEDISAQPATEPQTDSAQTAQKAESVEVTLGEMDLDSQNQNSDDADSKNHTEAQLPDDQNTDTPEPAEAQTASAEDVPAVSGVGEGPVTVPKNTEASTQTTASIIQYKEVSVNVTSINEDGTILVSVLTDPTALLTSGMTLSLDASAISNVTWTVGNHYKIAFETNQKVSSEQTIVLTAAVAL